MSVWADALSDCLPLESYIHCPLRGGLKWHKRCLLTRIKVGFSLFLMEVEMKTFGRNPYRIDVLKDGHAKSRTTSILLANFVNLG